jgi:hypothetical protein
MAAFYSSLNRRAMRDSVGISGTYRLLNRNPSAEKLSAERVDEYMLTGATRVTFSRPNRSESMGCITPASRIPADRPYLIHRDCIHSACPLSASFASRQAPVFDIYCSRVRFVGERLEKTEIRIRPILGAVVKQGNLCCSVALALLDSPQGGRLPERNRVRKRQEHRCAGEKLCPYGRSLKTTSRR